MADRHPYVSNPGGLVQVINHFRKSFPANVNAGTLKKLGYAPNNESYVLNVLRFVGLIDEEGNKTDVATKVFSLNDDSEFSEGFAGLVRASYKDLFDLYQEPAWDLDADLLITFFRSNDATTDIVGRRQASTFQLLAAFSGHGDVPEPRSSRSRGSNKSKPAVTKKAAGAKTPPSVAAKPPSKTSDGKTTVGLTVRIEVNLPAGGDQATYDRIFKSIRENLLNG